MSSSGQPASPKQTLLSAGMEAGGTLQETLPTVANWAPSNKHKNIIQNKRWQLRTAVEQSKRLPHSKTIILTKLYYIFSQ